MKKVIILASVLMMGIAVFGCEKKGDKNGEKQSKKSDIEQADNNNEYVIINGKKYDLSKGCDEILQEFVDDMYIDNCGYEEEEPIRKWEYDEEGQVVYYELDKDGNYVETEQKDFDERIVMGLSNVLTESNAFGKVPIEDIYGFRMGNVRNLNRLDFQMITPSGVGIGSTTKELEDAGAGTFGQYRYLIYLDGELVNYDDYVKDVERIQKLEDTQWAQEIENEYKYNCIDYSYRSKFNHAEEILSTKEMAYLLAAADGYAKIASGEKDTMLMFDFFENNDEIYRIMGFKVVKTNEYWKKLYEDFINNK